MTDSIAEIYLHEELNESVVIWFSTVFFRVSPLYQAKLKRVACVSNTQHGESNSATRKKIELFRVVKLNEHNN